MSAGRSRERLTGLLQRCWYCYLHAWSVLLAGAVFRLRTMGRRYVPPRGGVIIACNHQSFLDPVLVGLGLPRRACYLARRSLFHRSRAFSWLMRSLGAIPVRRQGADPVAFRQAVDRLRAGEAVLIFPEGTRTPDGAIGSLRKGVWNLARRARVPVVPTVIDGAFQAWPRHRRLPRPYPIRVVHGRPIPPEELSSLDGATFTELLRRRLCQLLQECRDIRKAVDHW